MADDVNSRLGTLEQLARSTGERVTLLTWALGITAGLVIALLATTVNISFQLGRIAGELTVLVAHVQLR